MKNIYYVQKHKDVILGLTTDEMVVFFTLLQKITDDRVARGKNQLLALVVEHDWPEYEPLLKTLEGRLK